MNKRGVWNCWRPDIRLYILSLYFYGFKNSPYKINYLNVCKALFHIHGATHPAPSCQTQKLAFHGFGLRAGPQGLIGRESKLSTPPRTAPLLLAPSRLPFGSFRLRSAPPPWGRAEARPAHAPSAPAALRAALCLVFSLPSLQSCIRVVVFPIVLGNRPRIV